MRILLVASAFNSLTQRVHTELTDRDHRVGVELALGDDPLRARVRVFQPDLILAPMLTTAIPEDIWTEYPVFIVHPGPQGDRGPSSLDWAIHEGASDWGVTVLQAVAEMDAGPIWASVPFPVAPCGKSELYRTEAADAAVQAVLLAVDRFATGTVEPEPLDYGKPHVRGRLRPYHGQEFRRIDWSADDTATVLRKLRAADSQPGVLDELFGREFFLHGGHVEDRLRGRAGALLAIRDGAICRATVDGAVWLPQLRPRRRPGEPPTCKLPATDALGPEPLQRVPEIPVSPAEAARRNTWSELRYREEGEVGYLEFAFAGGAMDTRQCRRLLAAYRVACARPVRVLVLGPRRDFFSNGIHLNVIEAAADPAAESWHNITAMNDVVEAILTTTDKLVVAALAGNAAAGGAMLALAADEIWCRASVVLNPHYRLMGLHGSEYWTYTLPRRVGAAEADRLTGTPLPVGARAAEALGLVDRVLPGSVADFWTWARSEAAALAAGPELAARLVAKKRRRACDEAVKPLAAYRAEELEHMRRNFFDPDEPYHRLRREFVHKVRPSATPAHLLG
ncbi:hydrogenase maturation protein [Nocardia terpenica]|uniref:enoyl-CoA hydratase-related protein n=1 Tax=Nocardia terpenica TaxID=455432 RepID=UPI001893DBE3|nr:enoyl-CoA hydratase-related protein [Nocardia terpenica]MBF6059333.1 hydrogenase maturation protein [Nocardia terpenica]MBF6103128.1 hydrogenase maturation protein [Nocardia terpenica]MBF6110683.1 hydrogenase maturation protein [Nocardia terpenica]MBF6116814.1 hydrogenase maturation protein [Nocardia terpenica]